MSVFVQYAPYTLDDGDWDTRRDEIGKKVIDLIGRFAPDIADCVEEIDVLGPPDIERRVGLTGGHIFQGECMPDQMWGARFASAHVGVPGVYLCGAATHPAGSVIALNGRNAAMAVLADLDADRSIGVPAGLRGTACLPQGPECSTSRGGLVEDAIAAARRSTIVSSCASVTTNGGPRSTRSPLMPSAQPVLG